MARAAAAFGATKHVHWTFSTRTPADAANTAAKAIKPWRTIVLTIATGAFNGTSTEVTNGIAGAIVVYTTPIAYTAWSRATACEVCIVLTAVIVGHTLTNGASGIRIWRIHLTLTVVIISNVRRLSDTIVRVSHTIAATHRIIIRRTNGVIVV